MAPRGAWAAGAPPREGGVPAVPGAGVAIIIPELIAECAREVFGTVHFTRFVKQRNEYDQGALYATKLKLDYESITAAMAFEEGFRRATFLRAGRLLLVRDPGIATYVFASGVQMDPRLGSPAGRCGVKVIAATRTLVMSRTVQRQFVTNQEEVVVAQGTKTMFEKHLDGVKITARIGVENGVEYLEGIGIPKTADWRDHLLGMPKSYVTEVMQTKTRGATVKFVFGTYNTISKRFARAGRLAREMGASVLITGLDVRVVLKQEFTTLARETAKKLDGVHQVFTDSPPPEVRAIGVTPDADTIAARAMAVEDPTKAGVMVFAKRGTKVDLWTVLAGFLGGALIASNCLCAAVAIPRSKLTEYIDAAIDDLFVIRMPTWAIIG